MGIRRRYSLRHFIRVCYGPPKVKKQISVFVWLIEPSLSCNVQSFLGFRSAWPQRSLRKPNQKVLSKGTFRDKPGPPNSALLMDEVFTSASFRCSSPTALFVRLSPLTHLLA